MPIISAVVDSGNGYLFVLSSNADRLDPTAKSTVKKFGAQYGHNFAGLSCPSWRLSLALAPRLRTELERAGYVWEQRELDSLITSAPPMGECSTCHAPRHLLSATCAACGSSQPATTPPRAADPADCVPPPVGWRDALRKTPPPHDNGTVPQAGWGGDSA